MSLLTRMGGWMRSSSPRARSAMRPAGLGTPSGGMVAKPATRTRGDEAIATVRQKFTRQQLVENQLRTVHTEVTQRETWKKTAEGWKLVFVDEVRDHVRLVDGQSTP